MDFARIPKPSFKPAAQQWLGQAVLQAIAWRHETQSPLPGCGQLLGSPRLSQQLAQRLLFLKIVAEHDGITLKVNYFLQGRERYTQSVAGERI